MSAYLIAEVKVTAPAVRGGGVEPLEGGRSPARITVKIRQKASRGKLILVEGA